MVNYAPFRMLEYIRDGLVEQEHYGFLFKLTQDGNEQNIGEDNDYPFFLRSCAKPLQATLLIDNELDTYYDLTLEEIAACCASHAGEPCHEKVVQNILDKAGLNPNLMKCGLHKPISKTAKKQLIKSGQTENILQNNCSGKHAMMLAICKKNGWDLETYDELNHPLQIAIKKKIYELCELKNEYPITKDGCGVPIYSMPLRNMLKGYFNVFFNDKYKLLKEAVTQNPYILGGEDRLDTAIISTNNNLIAKVGAGGICVVINTQEKAGIVIKISEIDMKARAICIIAALHQLGWLSDEALENELIKTQNKTEVLTLHNEKIGEAKVLFKL